MTVLSDGNGEEEPGLWTALGRLCMSREVGENSVTLASLALTQGNFLPICTYFAVVPVAQVALAAAPAAATDTCGEPGNGILSQTPTGNHQP